MLDTYEFCSEDLKKQLDGPRVAVREEEDRKANIDRAAKKAKMVTACLCATLLVRFLANGQTLSGKSCLLTQIVHGFAHFSLTQGN